MYAGLGDIWSDIGAALGPAASAAAVVSARIERAHQSGQILSVPDAIAQASAAGDIDPATARQIAALAAQIAAGATTIQGQAQSVAGVSATSRFLQSSAGWLVPLAAGAVLFLLLRRR